MSVGLLWVARPKLPFPTMLLLPLSKNQKPKNKPTEKLVTTHKALPSPHDQKKYKNKKTKTKKWIGRVAGSVC